MYGGVSRASAIPHHGSRLCTNRVCPGCTDFYHRRVRWAYGRAVNPLLPDDIWASFIISLGGFMYGNRLGYRYMRLGSAITGVMMFLLAIRYIAPYVAQLQIPQT